VRSRECKEGSPESVGAGRGAHHRLSRAAAGGAGAPIVGSGGGGDAVPARLRNALARILARSLPRLRPLYLPRAALAGGAGAQAAGGAGGGPAGGAHAPAGAEAGSAAGAARPTPLCHPGNMHGLLERKVPSAPAPAACGAAKGPAAVWSKGWRSAALQEMLACCEQWIRYMQTPFEVS